jgi:esterase/lipase superfamily enzyme
LAINPHDMRDSMDGMYDNNFYFNSPVDYMAREHAPRFFR